MNWTLILVILIFLVCIVRGWRRGLLRLLFSLISWIVLILLIAWATPYISNFLRNFTGLYGTIEARCAQTMENRLGTGLLFLTDSAASTMADWILKGLAFLIALLVAVIIVRIIAKALGLINRIPVLKGINRGLGLIGGAVEGYILVSLLFLLVGMVAGTSIGTTMAGQIAASPMLTALYNTNILLRLL